MNNLAIITARGGSKRIPRKNIRNFLGKPIISYSIESALQCGVFDEVMVSTDDDEIAEIAKKYGAKVPFKRSSETSNDTATTTDVILEVLREYKIRGVCFEYACCIYPTAPFITADSLKKGFEQMKESKTQAAIPVVKYSYPIQRALQIDSVGKLSMLYPEYSRSRSQDLTTSYHDAGQFYWFKVSAIKPDMELLKMNASPIIIPETQVQDIDTEEDWILAEMKYKQSHNL
ncbi:MAG: pseudaminic acid cytidylyltransferase [Candidatus Riflebacteria bacterium]|nr:pseudaminic acid cytidylyltransferase [Candidatus Riflebacteria bacterium]